MSLSLKANFLDFLFFLVVLKEGSISSELIKNTLRKINTPEHIIEEFNQSFIDPINQQLP